MSLKSDGSDRSVYPVQRTDEKSVTVVLAGSMVSIAIEGSLPTCCSREKNSGDQKFLPWLSFYFATFTLVYMLPI